MPETSQRLVLAAIALLLAACSIRVPPSGPPRDAAYLEASDPAPVAPYAPSPSYRGYVTVIDKSGRSERIPR